jgi:hypothetical protein
MSSNYSYSATFEIVGVGPGDQRATNTNKPSGPHRCAMGKLVKPAIGEYPRPMLDEMVCRGRRIELLAKIRNHGFEGI